MHYAARALWPMPSEGRYPEARVPRLGGRPAPAGSDKGRVSRPFADARGKSRTGSACEHRPILHALPAFGAMAAPEGQMQVATGHRSRRDGNETPPVPPVTPSNAKNEKNRPMQRPTGALPSILAATPIFAHDAGGILHLHPMAARR